MLYQSDDDIPSHIQGEVPISSTIDVEDELSAPLKIFFILDETNVVEYLAQHEVVVKYLCGSEDVGERDFKSIWKAENLSDGNMNVIYKVIGPANTMIVKQAIPFVRLVGPSWPMSPIRALYEYSALNEEALHVPHLVPKVLYFDPTTYAIFMEYLDNHIVMRKGMIEAIKYPKFSDDIACFMAHTLFKTSDIYLTTKEKRRKLAEYADNHELCKLTEQVVFTEPYFSSKNNRWNAPFLDEIVNQIRSDNDLKIKVTRLKHKFMTCTQALIHADLHTGSVMINQTSLKVIDPEFSFYGPMGFDIGAMIGNLFLSYFSQPGLATADESTTRNDIAQFRPDYQNWILTTVIEVWEKFQEQFLTLWKTEAKGDLYHPKMFDIEAPSCAIALERDKTRFMKELFVDSLGFAGAKMIRRIIGIAHVLDMESIPDPEIRALCEKKAIQMGHDLVVHASEFHDIRAVVSFAQKLN